MDVEKQVVWNNMHLLQELQDLRKNVWQLMMQHLLLEIRKRSAQRQCSML